ERLLELLLRVKNARPCLDDMAILRYRRCLDDGVAEIAVKDSKPARRVEGMPAAAQDFFIRTFLRRTHPVERSVACEPRLDQVTVEPGSPDGLDVGVKQACAEKLANEDAHAARRMEVIHIRLAIGIDAGEQW